MHSKTFQTILVKAALSVITLAAVPTTTSTVTSFFPNNVVLVDVFSAFQGRNGLLLIEKHNAGFNVHPTDAGYQVMTAAFKAAIAAH